MSFDTGNRNEQVFLNNIGRSAAALERIAEMGDRLMGKEAQQTHTPNGYDPAWVECINHVLEDREVSMRITDLNPEVWKRFVEPLIDSITLEPNLWR